MTPRVTYNSGGRRYHWREARVLLTRALTAEEAEILRRLDQEPPEDEEGLYQLKTNSFQDSYSLYIIAPTQLSQAERNVAVTQWEIDFLMDSDQ